MKSFSPARCTWRIVTASFRFQCPYSSQKRLYSYGLSGAADVAPSRYLLDPERLQRDLRARQLAVHPCEIDRHAGGWLVAAHVAEKPRLHVGLRHPAGLRPRQPRLAGARDVAADRALADPGGRRDLRARPPLVLQPQNLANLPHRQSLRHRARVRDASATTPSVRGASPPSERPVTCSGPSRQVPRNRRSRRVGTGRHVVPESTVTFARNTQRARCPSPEGLPPGPRLLTLTEAKGCASAPPPRRS